MRDLKRRLKSGKNQYINGEVSKWSGDKIDRQIDQTRWMRREVGALGINSVEMDIEKSNNSTEC